MPPGPSKLSNKLGVLTVRDYLPRTARHALIVVALASLVLAGCSPATSTSEVASGAETLAEFEGGEVTRAQFEEQAQAVVQQSAAQQGGEAEVPPEGSPEHEQLVAQIMPGLVATEISAAYAEENGISVTEEDVNQEIQSLKEQIGQQARGSGQDVSDEEAFQQALEQAGFTEEQLRSDVREQLPLQKVQQEVTANAEPTDEEIQQFYDENEDSFAEPETRCARHILFTPDQEQLAEDVKQEIEDGGDFAALAEVHSQDPGTAGQGGDLGCQPRTDSETGQPTYAPAFNDALFAEDAEEGDIIGPVETEFGYHVIELQEIREENTPPLEEVEGEIRDQLTQQQQATEFENWLDEQIEQRDVQYKQQYNPDEAAAPGQQGGGEGGG